MSRGPSGRIVVEIDPQTKNELHAALALQGKTLKDWFLVCVSEYLAHSRQLRLRLDYDADQKRVGSAEGEQ